jgi:uncharacterized protein YxjI
MRYIMKQKVFSLRDSFTIMSENETDIYQVIETRSFFGNKLSLKDMNSNELLFISQKTFLWYPTFEISKNGQVIAVVSKVFSWFKNKLVLSMSGPKEYSIAGTYWADRYTFKCGEHEVVQVSKNKWSLSDTYCIDIVGGEQDEIILATCIVIDLMFHNTNSNGVGE